MYKALDVGKQNYVSMKKIDQSKRLKEWPAKSKVSKVLFLKVFAVIQVQENSRFLREQLYSLPLSWLSFCRDRRKVHA